MSPDGSTVVSNIGPDNLTDYSTGDPALMGRDPYYASNINRFTHIMGETFRITIPNSNTGAGKGAIYTLQYGPVFNVFGTSGAGTPTDSLLVRGQSMSPHRAEFDAQQQRSDGIRRDPQ